ncbi:DUF4153 domain-containing protein [Bradyrhizobium uaiense]|uniref:DUF4173 domain-containing protein n=1 Tax=Bradyrhizobium uaiense TaxID=2594946 RepID=A0A6P1BKP3_9BRAD|nr:DUF4173 domain-containing protein [Bradyrhizobium uaiense]NEU98142.1 DUF4173 domain-containing protein [Bradyrhizobium uaiense]
MTSLAPPETKPQSIDSNLPPAKIAVIFALAALADWLFYDQRLGLSVVIFAIALTCASLIVNLGNLEHRRLLLAGAIVFAGLLPAFEDINAASLVIIALALGAALMLTTNPCLNSLVRGVASLLELYLVGPLRLFQDSIRAFNLPVLTRSFTLWCVPLLLGSLFVLLFMAANPLLTKWISQLNPGDPSSYLSIGRMLFWIAAAALVWPFIHIRWRNYVEVAEERPRSTANDPPRSTGLSFFGPGTILRSLILFNLLFSIQTILDLIYLWGNGTLPADVTYASYAHRGAYPLIITALLAASFVLVTMRPGGLAERSRVMRSLVYLWIGQNVLLVISAMLRLDLYVQIYLLTYWRIAAFVWMLLVVLGLVLILVRIVQRRSNEWLIHANLVTLAIVLYTCSLINFAAIIADYNIGHSREASGSGVNLDMDYLIRLGPQALPAIDRGLQLHSFDPNLVYRRNCLVQEQREQMTSWRSWGFRSWRLQRFLDRQQGAAAG